MKTKNEYLEEQGISLKNDFSVGTYTKIRFAMERYAKEYCESKDMKINSFKLGGVNWRVVINNDRMKDLNLLGLCETPSATITLTDDMKSEQTIEQTMYHELTHAILESLGYIELSSDEHFVQSFSVLLHQFEKTKK